MFLLFFSSNFLPKSENITKAVRAITRPACPFISIHKVLSFNSYSCKYYKKIVRLYKGILILNNIVLTDMEVQNDRDYKRKWWDKNSDKL